MKRMIDFIQGAPRLPRNLAGDIPAGCRQIVLVLAPEQASQQGRLWLLERGDAADGWRVHAGPFTATLGGGGLAWGLGEHRSQPPPGFPVKREGDRRSPAGVFRLPFAFGLPPENEAAHLRVPYLRLTEHTFGVDDPASRHYNRIVDDREVERDWTSHEAMSHQRLYEWGAFIAHNPECLPGQGSCLFLHLARSEGQPTAGCTAINAQDLQTVLRWLDADKQPLLVQGLDGW